MEKYSQVIFDKNTVEFVTVAAEYCGFLERARDMTKTGPHFPAIETKIQIFPEKGKILCEKPRNEAE